MKTQVKKVSPVVVSKKVTPPAKVAKWSPTIGQLAIVPLGAKRTGELAIVVVVGRDYDLEGETNTVPPVREGYWVVMEATGDQRGNMGSYPREAIFPPNNEGAKACQALITKERAEREAAIAERAERKAAREAAMEAKVSAERAAMEAARKKALKTGKTVKVTPPKVATKPVTVKGFPKLKLTREARA